MLLEIDKMVYGGEGLARLPADEKGRGKTVFVPFVLPGERVEASLSESRSGFSRARLQSVVKPSPERVTPGCPYFGSCGGCHYQHASYEAQLRFKSDILRETLRRTAKLELNCDIQVHGAEPWNYRNRTRMRVQHDQKFTLGYFRHNSHQMLAVERCPISSPLINQAISAVWELGKGGKVPDVVHGVQFFANHDDTDLLVEAYLRPGSAANTGDELADKLRQKLPELRGVLFFAISPVEDESRQHAPLAVERSEGFKATGASSLSYVAAGRRYRVSGGSFFQTNRFLVDALPQIALGDKKGRRALDLYAGAGLFTLPLAERFEDVVAVEASPHSFGDLCLNAPAQVKPVRSTTEAFLSSRAAKEPFDFVVVDPPRAGLGEAVSRALGQMSVPYVSYVSCDPATLSRDLRVLLEFGFRVEQAHVVDLFPQTFHIETVLHLAR